MITDLLWALIAVQIAMGAFDTLYHHEMTERLAWRPSQRRELQLHALRNGIYAVLFLMLGWVEPHGIFAALAAAMLAVEVVITLMDFVEEDMTRRLPASERVNHALLTLNYGAVLALLAPVLAGWFWQPTGLIPAYHGAWTWMATAAAAGVAIFGLRDLAAANRTDRLVPPPATGLIPDLGGARTVLVTGATGFIGRRLVEALAASGHNVIALVRDPAKGQTLPLPITLVTSLDQIDASTRIDAAVNLAGEPIANGLWTRAKRARIVASRVEVTRAVVGLMERLERKPNVLVNGSAIGWHGLWDDDPLDEASGFRPCFSHEVCHAWEEEAHHAEGLGVRVVILRVGLVLGIDGGLLARMLTPFEFGLGGPIGSGRQWMSWIGRDDLVRLIGHVIARDGIRGRVNATAPQPVTNAQFSAALARALGRPAVLRIPASVLHFLGGAMADELLIGGQRVLPHRACSSGFTFRHAALDEALGALLGLKTRPALRPRTPIDAGSPLGSSDRRHGTDLRRNGDARENGAGPNPASSSRRDPPQGARRTEPRW